MSSEASLAPTPPRRKLGGHWTSLHWEERLACSGHPAVRLTKQSLTDDPSFGLPVACVGQHRVNSHHDAED